MFLCLLTPICSEKKKELKIYVRKSAFISLARQRPDREKNLGVTET